jgi:PAS domain S-box-containing protein
VTEHLGILVLTAGANLSLGLWVYRRNPKDRIHRNFAFLTLTITGWTLSNAFVTAYAGTQIGTVAARAAFASASLIPYSFFLFATVFPSLTPSPSIWVRRLWLAAALAAFLVSLTPLLAKGTSIVNRELHVAHGALHPIFGAYILACLGYSLILLARKFRVSRGIERLQLRYVFVGIFLTAFSGTLTNLVIPLTVKSSRFSPYGPVFSLLMIALIAHAVIRYRLMNLRLVARRGATYFLAIPISASPFVAAIWLAPIAFGLRIQDLPLWLQLILALAFALLFQPLKNFIQISVDRYFFREVYDYQTELREISRAMASILDLDSLVQFASEVIGKIVHPEFVGAYALEATGTVFRPLLLHRGPTAGQSHSLSPIPSSAPLVRFLSAHPQHLQLEEVIRSSIHDPESQEVRIQLEQLGGDLVLPLLQDHRLTGFLILGPKLSGDAYFNEDIDLLSTLAGQASVAIKNAQLYSQVVVANQYVENIIATMDSAVIAVSADGLVTLFNSAAERLTGLSAQEIKSNLLNTLPSSIAALLNTTLTDAVAHTQVETTIPDPAGRLTPVIGSTAPLRDRDSHVFGAVAVFSDLTRLKQLESAKQRSERLASIGALSAGIAHEIKNPLVAIKTFAELIPERFTDEDFRTGFSQVVIREIERIDQLVARLRGLALPSGQALVPLNIRRPLEETLALLRGQLEQSQTVVRTSYPEDTPLVAADSAQLKQLFLNLIVNSLEAMKPGGELSIAFHCADANDSPVLAVQISDTGSGIRADLLDKIFDPFVTTKEHGSGLGLSICRGIADAHRATIRAYNNADGKGATIVVEFPILVPTTAAVQ